MLGLNYFVPILPSQLLGHVTSYSLVANYVKKKPALSSTIPSYKEPNLDGVFRPVFRNRCTATRFQVCHEFKKKLYINTL
jgi:hypothetical protein